MEQVRVPLPPARPESVSVTLAAHFERLIATGQLAPGARLPSERELAASFSVSRSTLREALHELETKRLIERKPGRGTVVKTVTSEEIVSALHDLDGVDHASAAELRLTIEPSIAALAAKRATAANLVQLREALERSHDGLSALESLRLDIEFHQLVASAAANPLLFTLQALAAEWTQGVRSQSHTSKMSRRRSKAGHEAIYRAIAAHDSAAARQAMEEHLKEVERMIERAEPLTG